MSVSLRQLSLVRLTDQAMLRSTMCAYPFISDMPLIYFGEIPNMPEHGVFAGYKSGRVYAGYHIYDFQELTEDEV